MFNSLLTASIVVNNIEFVSKFPRMYLLESDIKALDWLVDYYTRFGTMPTKDRFKETEHAIYWNESLITSPLEDLYEMALLFKQKQYVERGYADIESDFEKGIVPAYKIMQMGNVLQSATSTGVISLADANRDSIYSVSGSGYIKTYFNIIDEEIGNIQPGEFVLFVARPETWKTLLTNFMAVRNAADSESPKKVIYISAEMTPTRIIMRMDAIAGKFNPKYLRIRNDQHILDNFKSKAKKAWSIIDKNGGSVFIPEVSYIYAQTIKDLVDRHKPDLVIVDAIYKVMPDSGSKTTDWRQDKEVISAIAQIARITKTPVIGTTQLKRDSQNTNYDLSDIAFSDSYAQEADTVIAISKVPTRPNNVILSLLKCRDGSKNAQLELNIDWNNMDLVEQTYIAGGE